MKFAVTLALVVAIGGLTDSIRVREGKNASFGSLKSRVNVLESQVYHDVGGGKVADDSATKYYLTESSEIDAFRPDCGQFKQHESFLDSKAFECASGHRILPDYGDNTIDGHSPNGGLVRKRRMAGGHKVLPNEAPHYAQMVGFFWNGMAFRSCGGTIIHKNLILTAGHCMRTLIEHATQIAVIVGTNYFNIVENKTRHDGTLVYVNKHVIERDFKYGSYSTHDLALLKLSKNLVYNEQVQPACVRLQSVPRNDAICFIAGRGVMNRHNEYFDYMSGFPMEMDSTSHNRPENETFSWRPLVEGTICHGDSGAGLVCYDDCDDSGIVRSHLVGVVTSLDYATFACEERNQRGGFVNLHGLRNRVRAMIADILSK